MDEWLCGLFDWSTLVHSILGWWKRRWCAILIEFFLSVRLIPDISVFVLKPLFPSILFLLILTFKCLVSWVIFSIDFCDVIYPGVRVYFLQISAVMIEHSAAVFDMLILYNFSVILVFKDICILFYLAKFTVRI